MTDEAKDLLQHRHDEDEWSDQAEAVSVRHTGSEVVSFRLPAEELDGLVEAAGNAGESLSEFIRKALALRLHGTPIGPSVEVSSGATRLTIRSHIVVGGGKDAPASFVTDTPPLTVAAV
jgi:ribbon-helix-helix CopG family protein